MSDLEKLLKSIGESCKELGKSLEKNSLQTENVQLKEQISEMQSHIDCLKAELEELQMKKTGLPTEPIKVADMLICASYTRKNCMTGDEYEKPVYEKWQLKQIAKHLLVYCNNAEVK